MDLVIALSNKVYLKLVEDKDLKTLDEITSLYKDEENLMNSEEYREKIEDFYKRYKNYIYKMDTNKKNPGTVKIYTYDSNLYGINVLYKKNKNKMNTKRLIDAIIKSFKDYIDIELLLNLSNKCGFFLDSDYNYRIKGLGRTKKSLYDASSINDSTMKSYNRLLNIIKSELLKGYNKETKEVSEKTYIYARYIDSYLDNLGIETIKRLKINEKKIKNIEKPKINKNLPKELIGKGTSYLIEFLEEVRDKNDIPFTEEEYTIDIDDFSFEEKDDEETWFK